MITRNPPTILHHVRPNLLVGSRGGKVLRSINGGGQWTTEIDLSRGLFERGSFRHVSEEVMDQDFRYAHLFHQHRVKVASRGEIAFDGFVRKAALEQTRLFVAKRPLKRRMDADGIIQTFRYGTGCVEMMDGPRAMALLDMINRDGPTCYPFAFLASKRR